MDITPGRNRGFEYRGVQVRIRVYGDATGWFGDYELTFPAPMEEPTEIASDSNSHPSADAAAESCEQAAKRRINSKFGIRGTSESSDSGS